MAASLGMMGPLPISKSNGCTKLQKRVEINNNNELQFFCARKIEVGIPVLQESSSAVGVIPVGQELFLPVGSMTGGGQLVFLKQGVET
jgi:hypothetical protein